MVKDSDHWGFSASALVTYRRQLGLSQEALARRSGVATVTVAKLEEGRIVDPKGSTLAKLAHGLGCPVDSLLSRNFRSAGTVASAELVDD